MLYLIDFRRADTWSLSSLEGFCVTFLTSSETLVKCGDSVTVPGMTAARRKEYTISSVCQTVGTEARAMSIPERAIVMMMMVRTVRQDIKSIKEGRRGQRFWRTDAV